MKKPERLWVLYNDSSHLPWECRESPLSSLDQEYVRADIAAARIEELEADRDELQRCDYCGEHVERGDLWLISGANGYCSATCARDHAQHERDHADDLDREDAREQG